jgi:hypothetical protein
MASDFANQPPLNAMIAVTTKAVDRLYPRGTVQQDNYKIAKTLGALTVGQIFYHSHGRQRILAAGATRVPQIWR